MKHIRYCLLAITVIFTLNTELSFAQTSGNACFVLHKDTPGKYQVDGAIAMRIRAVTRTEDYSVTGWEFPANGLFKIKNIESGRELQVKVALHQRRQSLGRGRAYKYNSGYIVATIPEGKRDFSISGCSKSSQLHDDIVYSSNRLFNGATATLFCCVLTITPGAVR